MIDMDYDHFKTELKELRGKVVDDPKLSTQEREDPKMAILLLIMHINHRIVDGT